MGSSSWDAEPLFPKVPHLRNMYQKVGMFGAGFGFGSVGADPFLGDQVRGFGFNSDGAIPTLFLFNSGFDFHPIFNQPGIPLTPEGDTGQAGHGAVHVRLRQQPGAHRRPAGDAHGRNAAVAGPRINLLRARAEAGECELVAKGRLGAQEVGFVYLGGGLFASDRQALPHVADVVPSGGRRRGRRRADLYLHTAGLGPAPGHRSGPRRRTRR